MPLTLPAQLRHILEASPCAPRYLVAYSGGRDSHVLLHAMAGLREALPGDLRAIHVNHGLHPQADQWARHCRSVCDALSVPLHIVSVDARAVVGESPEAAARHARYQAFTRHMEQGDCLLTAHHCDDQAETLLLQLLRGAGPHGLASMPVRASFAGGTHLRPLLGCGRAQLAAYAAAHHLQWIEDPSNQDTGLRRNFIRHEVLPLLATHWPAAARTLARSAAHCAEASRLLDDVAATDLQRVAGGGPRQLNIPMLNTLDEARRYNVIRHWIGSQGFPLPRQTHLEHILRDVLQAAADRMPRVCWAGTEVRRYRDTLCLMAPLSSFDNRVVLPWDLRGTLTLPAGLGMLEAVTAEGGDVLTPDIRKRRDVTVRFRQGGEICHPAGHGHALPLKKLFQEQGIPPWERERIPLIYVGETLTMVVGICVCESHAAAWGVTGIGVCQREPVGQAL